MANELGIVHNAFPVSFTMHAENLAATATEDLIFDQSGAGFVVPTGYVFHPMLLHAEANTAVTAQTITFKVTDDGAEVSNGPEVLLTTAIQTASGVARIGAAPIAAGAVVGISATTPGSFTPTTADVDAVLSGVLVQA